MVRSLLLGVSLAVSILAGGCASRHDPASKGPSELGPQIGTFRNSALNAPELAGLHDLPPKDQQRLLDTVLASHPDDPGARFMRTQADALLGDNAAVVADSEVVLRDPGLDRGLRQWTLEWRAESLVHLRRFDEAIAAADQALAIDASSAGALFARGWARFLDHRPDGALADLDRALEIQPDEAVGYARRAAVLVDGKEFDRAAQDYRRAIALAPDDGPSHRGYGILLYRTRDLERALVEFDAAMRLMPTDPFALTWRAQTHRALKHFDSAAADEDRADALGTAGEDLFNARNNVAIDLEEEGDLEGAASELSRLLAWKRDANVASQLARVQWFGGRFGQAVETFRSQSASPVSREYEALWLFLMRARANPADEVAAQAELAARAQAGQPRGWTDTLVDIALGRLTLQAALAEADAADTPRLRAGRRCEADYYAAEQLLVHGLDASARRLLDEASEICPSTYLEARAVAAERRLLEARSPVR